jgi:3-deoxy-D-manno-octulosonic-acid transferase
MNDALPMAVYSFALLVGLTLSAPFWLFRMVTSGRYREGLAQRLGHVPASVRAAVTGMPVVWVHAVSVGEVLAVERLIGELRRALPGYVIALSTTTATGQRVARQRLPDLPIFFFPLDFAFAVRPRLRALQPKLVILVESELWPRMLTECERSGIPVAVVNARISDRSFRRTYPFRGLWLRMANKVTLFLPQGVETANRLSQLGIAAARIGAAGNLKFDPPRVTAQPDENAMTRRIRSLLFGGRLVVCGSTHEGEEAMLLASWQTIRAAVPDAVLVLAPRHPERFDSVWTQIRAGRFGGFRCSHLLIDTEPIFGGLVLLLDTLGDLASFYGIASVAFIGGSLVPRGGHNPLEATRFGVPTLIGRSYENFREIVTELLPTGALRLTGQQTLAADLIAALQQPLQATAFTGQTGATQRTLAALLALLERSQ